MLNLDYHNIKVGRYGKTNQIVVKGEVTNNSGRPYSAVAVRVVIFIKSITIANVVFTINGLLNGSSKEFEKVLDDLEYEQVAKDITRCEMYTESAY
ncbi:MAG: FxLYD domain-containing protein [Candidatus Omnitrophica bacterium]|nr:FxLYD domain-containing protein [Candidatus Omnitrophota bacterium]